MRHPRRPTAPEPMVRRINRLEAHHHGKIVAIEPESGEYFIGDTAMAALRKARKSHPGRAFVFKRIGHAWAFQMTGGMRRVESAPARLS